MSGDPAEMSEYRPMRSLIPVRLLGLRLGSLVGSWDFGFGRIGVLVIERYP